MTTLSMLRSAELSTLSNLSYSDRLSNSVYGWTGISKYSYSLNSGLSLMTVTKGDIVVIAFRGTDSLSDLSADSSFITGKWNPQFEEAAKIVKEIRLSFGEDKVLLTGHSLGGGIAQVMSKLFNLPGASFDAPGAEAITRTPEFQRLKATLARDTAGLPPPDFNNFVSERSLISSIGDHVGTTTALVPIGSSIGIKTVIPLMTLFVGGPISILSLFGLFMANVARTHPIAGMERTLWAYTLLEEELSLDRGRLTETVTRRSAVRELSSLGGNPDDEVRIYRDRTTGALKATLTSEKQGYVLRSADLTEKVTLTQAVDGGFDCKIERIGRQTQTCRLRFDSMHGARVEVDINSDGKTEQIVQSGRSDDGFLFQKVSYIDDAGSIQSSEETRWSMDERQRLVLLDSDGDGQIEERRQILVDDSEGEFTSVARLGKNGRVQSELLLRSDPDSELTVYDLLVDSQSVGRGLISRPVDEPLIMRLMSRPGDTLDLRSMYASEGDSVGMMMINTRSLSAQIQEIATRFIGLQIQVLHRDVDSDSLSSFPVLMPSDALMQTIGTELSQFADRSAVDIRVSPNDELLLVSESRAVHIRTDGSIRRQIIGLDQLQLIENLDADGFLFSSVRTASRGGQAAGREIVYDFHYRDGSTARIEMGLVPGIGEVAMLSLRSDAFLLKASYDGGRLVNISDATVDGRQLSPAALDALAMQFADLSVDELQSAFSSLRQKSDVADDIAGPAKRLSDALNEVRSDLIPATDHFGLPVYLSPAERRLQTMANGTAALIDGLGMLRAIRTGEPLPITATGLRLGAGLDMLDGSRDLPGLAGSAAAAGAVLSLMSLAQAWKEGDGIAAIHSASFATAGIAEAATFLQKSGVIDAVPNSLASAGSTLNEALPYISLVNSIAHGDKTGAAVAVADITMMKVLGAYTVPVIGWAYAIFSLMDGLFTEVPDPWGNARFVWRDGALAIDSAGETGGEDAVRHVMQLVQASMNSMIERAREQNPGSQLGIIANRMPGLIMTMEGYQFKDIDGLSGAERHPGLRFDTSGKPYNAVPGSPESFIGLIEAMIRSGLAREAIAPLWEVQTAVMQVNAGDPRAGLSEEERAGSDGLLATVGNGNTQVFRPVVLDLDGDGIDRIAGERRVLFDIDSTGFKKQTDWIAGDDAMLVLDRNYNGKIDSGREMFSNAVVALARRGLAGMAWTDANHDGRLTAADPVWEELQLWRDLDGNAVQDDGELTDLSASDITELNYAMGTYTRHGVRLQLSSPNLDAEANGLRINVVPQGILIEASEDNRLSLLVSRIDDKTAVEPGRDGAEGIEDIELLINGQQLLANDLLGGFAGRPLQIASVDRFNNGTGFVDANGIVHFQPAPDYTGDGAGFDYIALADNGQTARGRVDVRLAPINDAPTLARVDRDMLPIYGYEPVSYTGQNFRSSGGRIYYSPYSVSDEWGRKTTHDTPIAFEASGRGQVVGADIDDDPDALRYELLAHPQYGAVSLEADGRFVYTSWKAPDTPSDRVMADGQYGAWMDGIFYNANNISGPAVYPTSDAFQVRITDPHGASSVVTVTMPHYGPYLPPTPQGGGKKPIAVDLDGDGFEFVNVDDSDIFFDVNGDGWRRRTSWVGPDDGLLAMDINGDGKIDQPGEIAFAGQLEGAQTDLEGLAAFDTNGDGEFNASDRDWSRFGIWQDRNQNGFTDGGEFQSLEAMGAKAVHLTSNGQFQIINGQTVHGTGRLTMADGSMYALADVTLAFSQERRLPGQTNTRMPPSPFTSSGTRSVGNDESELILARAGSDVVEAYSGNDVILDDIGNDMVHAGDGDDSVFTGSDHDFIDAGNGNDQIYAGSGDDIVFGGDGNDMILLQQGNDIAFGGLGDDLIAGEDGNDVISGDLGNDQIFGGNGNDALFGGRGDDSLSGMQGNDRLDGGEGDDALDGGTGADLMMGGAGNDRYWVDDLGDIVLEEAADGSDAGGEDTVFTTLDAYRIGERIEHLQLLDVRSPSSPRVAFGNALANRLTGNQGTNILYGGDGNDLIDGGQGADLLIGGSGDDIYLVDNLEDQLIELPGEGQDEIRSAVSFTLPEECERLLLTGLRDLRGKGNALDNLLVGNAGDNHLDGGAGADELRGGDGNDVYYVDQAGDIVIEYENQGLDSVNAELDWQLSSHVENLMLIGDAPLMGLGNELDNLLRGNRGSNLLAAGMGNDMLIGALGNDILDGGAGDDIYVYQCGDGLDQVIDASGRDRFMLSGGIRPDDVTVRLVQSAHGLQARFRLLDDTGEELIGEGMDIALSKGPTGRLMPVIEEVEFSDGHRLALGDLYTRIQRHDLHPSLINLNGNRSDDIIFGNQRGNRLAGKSGNDALFGEGGEDVLSGDAGNDFLAGGDKNDTLHTGTGYNLIAFNRHDDRDDIISRPGAINTLSLGNGIAVDDLSLRRQRHDLILELGKKDAVTLRDWYAGSSYRNLNILQVIGEARCKTDKPRVSQIDFLPLVARFDQESGQATITSPWALTEQRLASYLSTDAVAVGGELAIGFALRRHADLSATIIADSMYRLDPTLAGQRLEGVAISHA